MIHEKLVFVENKEHIKDALDYCESDKNAVIVAVSPDVVSELEALGQKFALLEDYYSDEELMEHCATDGFALMDRICDYIDTKAAAILFEPHEALPFAKGCYYNLKVVIDTVYSRALILRQLLEKSRAGEIIYFSTDKEKIQEDLYFDAESIYSRLLESIFSKRISCKAIHAAHTDNRKPISSAIGGVKKFLKANVRYAINMAKRCREYFMSSVSDKKTIYECVVDNDVKLTTRRLRNQFRIVNATIFAPHPYFGAVNKDINIRTRRLWGALRQDAEFKKIFDAKGINFFEIVQERLEYLTTNTFAKMLSWHRIFEGVFKKNRRNAAVAITSNNCSYIPKALSFVCAKNKVPFVEFQHGGLGYFEFPSHYYDNLRCGDYFFSYGGDGLKNLYVKRYGADGRKIKPVGSPMLDDLTRKTAASKRIPGLKPVIIYAPTNMMKQRRYFSYHALADNTYYLFQKKLIDMFSALGDGFEFIVKLHPNPSVPASPITEYIDRIKAGNISVERDGYLAKYLHSADGLIIDSPTTVLLQGIAAGNAVFVINNVLKITGEAEAMLKKEVYRAQSVEELRAALVSAFSPDGNVARPAGAAGDFFKEYGTLGDSAKRAAEELKALAGIKSFTIT